MERTNRESSNPHDRKKWRHGVKSAMHAASQSSGREPTYVDNASEPRWSSGSTFTRISRGPWFESYTGLP